MSDDITDYTWQGDTWWGVRDGTCPDCSAALVTNGTVVSCTECEHWAKTELDERRKQKA